MDSIESTFKYLTETVSAIDPRFVLFILRAFALYGIATLGCTLLLLRGNRSVVVQIVCAVSAAVLAAILPLDWIHIENATFKTWVLALAVILLTVLPAVLARVLVPTVGAQQKLRKVLYLILVVLFIGNFIGGCQ